MKRGNKIVRDVLAAWRDKFVELIPENQVEGSKYPLVSSFVIFNRFAIHRAQRYNNEPVLRNRRSNTRS